MLRIVSSRLVQSQTDWLDEIRDVDWGDDKVNDVEWPNRAVNEDNLSNYLVDDIEEQPVATQPELQPANSFLEPTTDNIIEDYRDEIPSGSALLGIPENTTEVQYADPKQLIYEAIDNTEVVSFDYTNRHGDYAGLRTVEPHYTFMARTTGNEVLVTFDRDVNEIRAFILGNIHPGGVRYKGVQFNPKPEIMRGVL